MPHYRVTETGLMVPVIDSSKGEPRFKCTVITGSHDGENSYCGKAFHDPHSFERHVARCSEEHLDAIREAAPSSRLPAFYGETAGIPDVEAWLDEQDAAGVSHRQKILEGREKL